MSAEIDRSALAPFSVSPPRWGLGKTLLQFNEYQRSQFAAPKIDRAVIQAE